MASATNSNLYFSDLYAIYRLYRWWIIALSLIFSGCASMYYAWQPAQYRAQATFQDAGFTDEMNTNNNSMEQILKGSLKQNTRSSVLLYSDTLLLPLIKELGLQIKGSSTCFVKDFYYEGKKRLKDTLLYKNNKIYLQHMQQAYEGEYKEKKRCNVTIYPLEETLKRIKRRLIIKQDKQDSSIFHLYFHHENPFLAKEFLNRLMDIYKSYLATENQRIYQEQLNFLQTRRQSIIDNIEKSMEKHVHYLQANLGEDGFLFLEQILQNHQKKLQEIEQRMLKLYTEKETLKKWKSNTKGVLLGESPIKGDFVALSNQLNQLIEKKEQLALDDHIKKKRVNFSPTFIQMIFSPLKQSQKINEKFYPIDRAAIESVLNKIQEQFANAEQLINDYQYIQKITAQDPFAAQSFGQHFHDSTMKQMIESIGSICAKLQQKKLFSPSEQSALKENLHMQMKRFQKHLNHCLAFEKEQQIHQKQTIYHLKQQLFDLLELQINELEQQIIYKKNKRIMLIENELKELEKKKLLEMKKVKHVPQKWLSENKMNMHMNIDTHILKSFMQTFEYKQAQSLMSLVLAKPIVPARLPVRAQAKWTGLVAILSWLFSFLFINMCYILYRLKVGVPITFINASYTNRPYFSLSKLNNRKTQLSTLRQLCYHLKHTNLFLFSHFESKIIDHLGKLLQQQNQSLLFIDATAQITHLTPIKHEHFDRLTLEGTDYLVESISTLLEKPAIKKLCVNYHHVIIMANIPFDTIEGKILSEKVDVMFAQVKNQTKESIESFLANSLVLGI